jgi:muramoyltetrapeptide carboxypeptidase
MPATGLFTRSTAEDLGRLRQAMFSPSLAHDGLMPRWRGRPLCGGSKAKARGRLVGGNLSLLAATTGTPWGLDAAGLLDVVTAVVLGDFQAGGSADESDRFGQWEGNPVEPGLAGEDLFWREIVGLGGAEGVLSDVVVLVGCPFGHGRRNVTLPMGASVEVDGSTGEVKLLVEADGSTRCRAGAL